jgi:predicted hydrolase (HD superfamily)
MKEAITFFQTCDFEDFDRDNYSDHELSACELLLSQYQGLIEDPYLMHELYRIHHVYERKYKFANSKVGQAVFSIDKLPGLFQESAMLRAADPSKI